MEESNHMNDEYNVFAIAECVLTWGISVECEENLEEIYDEQSLECLDNIVAAVINISYAFEVDVDEIFSRHCNQGMTTEEFIDFVDTICNILGKCKGYFGFILPCAFVREVISRFKTDLGCTEFCPLAEVWLARSLNEKFKKFGGDCSWDGLMAFCNDINQKFEKFRSSEKTSSDCLSRENMTDNDNSIANMDNDSVPTALEPVVSDMMETDTLNKDTHRENNKFELPDGALASKPHSDVIQNLSKEISGLCFGNNNELCKIEENEAMDSISESDGQLQEKNSSEHDGMDEIYDIIMPDVKMKNEVFKLIHECLEAPPRKEVDETCAFKYNSNKCNESTTLSFNHEIQSCLKLSGI